MNNRDPQPNYNRGADCNETIMDIEAECKFALVMGDKESLLEAIELIKYLCEKTQTDEVE